MASVSSVRHEAHVVFDRLWMRKICSRDEAYFMLADLLDLPLDRAHFGKLNYSQCVRAIEHFSKMERRKKPAAAPRSPSHRAKIFSRQIRREKRKSADEEAMDMIKEFE
jgi:hypothetical protein